MSWSSPPSLPPASSGPGFAFCCFWLARLRWLAGAGAARRSEEHTSELQSRLQLVCRLLLEKKKIQCTRDCERDYNARLRPDLRHENESPARGTELRQLLTSRSRERRCPRLSPAWRG